MAKRDRSRQSALSLFLYKEARSLRKFVKRFFWIVLLVFLLDVVISIGILIHDLKVRYPNLDFSKARFGVASWYSKTDKGINEHTANRERFDDRRKTCASWDYPFGTRLLVINPMNGKWVVCRVNDRGPAKRLNRQLDLTKTAFQKIANLRRGLIHVTFLPIPKQK